MSPKNWIVYLGFFCILAFMMTAEQRQLVRSHLISLTAPLKKTRPMSNLSRGKNITPTSNLCANKTTTQSKLPKRKTSRKPAPQRRAPSTKSFTVEFESYGNILSSVTISNVTYQSPCVLVAASGTGYRYSKAWMTNRRSEGIPFVLFEVNTMRMGELTAHYARIPALLATAKLLPRARYLVYTDVDTLVDFDAACAGGRGDKSLLISSKIEKGRTVLRTNWFIFNTWHKRSNHLLLTWLYNGRGASLQDQTVLNELYVRKKWMRDSIQLLDDRDNVRHAEIKHCGSYMVDRDKCIESLRMDVLKREKKRVVGK